MKAYFSGKCTDTDQIQHIIACGGQGHDAQDCCKDRGYVHLPIFDLCVFAEA